MERHDIQRLFKQHYAKMLRVARTILYDEQESKDVVSDIFEGLLRGRTMLMPDTEERYLLTSVRNQCLKRIRHQETRLRMETAPAEQTSDAEHEDERIADIIEHDRPCLDDGIGGEGLRYGDCRLRLFYCRYWAFLMVRLAHDVNCGKSNT